jgi:hypothetical protein
MSWITRWFQKQLPAVRQGKRPAPRLYLEELEPRWVPATTSTNWSGYAVNAAAGSVTAVSAEFTVPTVSGSGATTYSSTWVGIDGFNTQSVEQTGIEADVVRGVAQYSAWYEMYPNAPVTLTSLAVHPGDTIAASVVYNNSKFTLSIQDLSDPKGANSFSITISAPNAARSSAEWIEEAPSSSRGVLPLAQFTPVTFSNAQATIGGTTGVINNAAWAGQVEAINMVSRSGVVEASTGPLNALGNGFTVTYGAAGTTPTNPTPPTPPPSTVATTTTLSGAVNTLSPWPSVVLTAVVSPSVSVGGKVELLSGGTVLAVGTVQDVGGIDEVQFVVTFFRAGTYSFTASYLDAGPYAASSSNTVTVTVF